MAEIQLLADLAARSLEASHGIVKRSVDGGHEKIDIPGWGPHLVIGTILIFLVFIFSLEYTLEAVVGTLTMVETPAAPITLSNVTPIAEDVDDEPNKDPAKVNLLQEPEALNVGPAKPITSKIRTTIKHITAQAGFWARWRGFVVFEVYAIATGITRLFLRSTPLAYLPGSTLLITVLVTVAFSNLHMAWTHAIISTPSRLRWYQRLGDRKAFKALMVPSAVRACAASAVFYLGHGFSRLVIGLVVSVQQSDGGSNKGKWLFPLGMIASILFSILLLLYVYVPAYVTHARVEASLLPESQDTIVPFDRSFEGRVLPVSLGGPGAVSFVDAWKSFDWEARRRVLKLFAKIILILTALFIVGLHIVGLEAWLITGGRIGEIIRRMQRNHGETNPFL